MTSALVRSRAGVMAVLESCFPEGSIVELADHANIHTIEQLSDNRVRAAILKGGLKTERISRSQMQRIATTLVVVRCKLGHGAPFQTTDEFVQFMEQLQQAIELVTNPIVVLASSLEVPIDPDEYTEAGIASSLLQIDSSH